MTSLAQLVALAALIPAAANPSLMVRGGELSLALCSGAGAVSVPLDQPMPGETNSACCNKGCHSSDKRKRDKGGIDPPQ